MLPRCLRASYLLAIFLTISMIVLGVGLQSSASAMASGSAAAGSAKSAPGQSAMTTVSTQAQLVSAITAATPGTTISLNSGTYFGGLTIRKSGTQAQPIVLQPAGNGPVTLSSNLTMPSCNASSPDTDRTVEFGNGASYWTLQGLNIVGGIDIYGGNSLAAHLWFSNLLKSGDWQTRRAVPGRGTNDPIAAQNAVAYVGNQIGTALTPADGIQILNDVITRVGIHVSMGRYGVISRTQITDIACGTGPGVWFGTYSDGWTIDNNTVSNIASSTFKHYMQEGIRIDGASSYNLIEDNTVSDLPGDGRAFTTDQDGSYNTFVHNIAQNVSIGFNDEMSGWGNDWEYNTVTGYRAAGFAFRMMDGPLLTPSMNSSTYQSTIRCNSASGTGDDLKVGASKSSGFASNMFQSIAMGKNIRSYWGSQGNTWDGSSTVPAKVVTGNLAGC
jgi:hypothetical protein